MLRLKKQKLVSATSKASCLYYADCSLLLRMCWFGLWNVCVLNRNIGKNIFFSIQTACKQKQPALSCCDVISPSRRLKDLWGKLPLCKRRERVGPWSNNIHMDYRIQHFLWIVPLCKAGLLNMLSSFLKAYVEVQILHKWNAGPCLGLYFTQLVVQH